MCEKGQSLVRRAVFYRALLVFAGALALTTGLGLFTAGWYFADVLHHDGLIVNRNRAPDVQVVGLDGDRITLSSLSGKTEGPWTQAGIVGLDWQQGYSQVGPVIRTEGSQVERRFISLKGEQPPPGATARIDAGAFPRNPQVAFGLPFEEVSYSSPLGTFPAWLVPGNGSTWAIFVHGRNSDPKEGLRILPSLTGAGLSTLLITYRNDADVPARADGLYRFGATEWEDLDGAAHYALDHGATKLVLVGDSMGGSIVSSFLYRSSLADRVVGVILDAPALDFQEAVRLQAGERGVPGIVTSVAEAITAVRFGVDWGALNYLYRSDRLKAPILLFHGEADRDVPIATSDALAAARPDLVRYIRTPGAGHVRSWNVSPDAYAAHVTEFLQSLAKS